MTNQYSNHLKKIGKAGYDTKSKKSDCEIFKKNASK